MSWRLVNYFDFQITFQLTNFQTFSINASIFLKLWRGRCSGGWLEGKEWATLTTSPDRIGLYCGRSYSEVAMRLLARKWKSQMQNRFFFLFLVVIVWHNPRTISWYSQILWCYFCNYWQQHTRFPFAKYSDCQFYKEGEGSLCAIFFIQQGGIYVHCPKNFLIGNPYHKDLSSESTKFLIRSSLVFQGDLKQFFFLVRWVVICFV